MSQVVYYHPGVGSSGSVSDEIAGGVFGAGVGEVGTILTVMFIRFLLTGGRILEKLTASSQQTMSLAMRSCLLDFPGVHLLLVAWL
jgi:hypothetical protein